MELMRWNKRGRWFLAASMPWLVAVGSTTWGVDTADASTVGVESEALATSVAAIESNAVGPVKPVLVVNAPSRPVPVVEAAREPFNKVGNLNIRDGGIFGFADIITVPEGKQLVVTHVSIEMPAGSPMSFSVIGIGPGFAVAYHPLIPVASGPLGIGGPPSIAASQPLNMILQEGIELSCRAMRDSTAGEAMGFCCISGYLVDTSALETIGVSEQR